MYFPIFKVTSHQNGINQKYWISSQNSKESSKEMTSALAALDFHMIESSWQAQYLVQNHDTNKKSHPIMYAFFLTHDVAV